MKNKTYPSEHSRNNFPRTTEEVPFFPFSQVRMENNLSPVSNIEEAQYDFEKNAGLPRLSPNEIDDQ